jgi:hypothetical protein
MSPSSSFSSILMSPLLPPASPLYSDALLDVANIASRGKMPAMLSSFCGVRAFNDHYSSSSYNNKGGCVDGGEYGASSCNANRDEYFIGDLELLLVAEPM